MGNMITTPTRSPRSDVRSRRTSYPADKKIAPANDKTRQAIEFLMYIFKDQAKKNGSGTDTQRVGIEAEKSQRVITEEEEKTTGVQSEEMIMDKDDLITTKELEVY